MKVYHRGERIFLLVVILAAIFYFSIKEDVYHLPGWLVIVFVFYLTYLLVVWIWAKERTEKDEIELATRMIEEYKNELKTIKSAFCETIELQYYEKNQYNKRNGHDQFEVTKIDNKTLPSDKVLLVSFTNLVPRKDYFGTVYLLYCDRNQQTGNLKTISHFKKSFTKEQWNGGTEKISLHQLFDGKL